LKKCSKSFYNPYLVIFLLLSSSFIFSFIFSFCHFYSLMCPFFLKS
jgi:hypothetical protein